MNEAINDLCHKTQDAEKGMIDDRPNISFVSDTRYNNSNKCKSEFIEVM